MRLIDADKIHVVPAEDDNVTGMGMTREEQDAYNEGVEAAMAKIRNAKTIDKPSIAICDSAENFDPVYCAERAGDVEYNTGREDALLEVLEIIDSMIDSDEFHNHNENAVCRQIKNRVLALKEEQG